MNERVTFVTQSSRAADNVAFSPERLLNVYPESAPEGAKGVLLLRSQLGTQLVVDLEIGALRAIIELNDIVYAVGSSKLFSINSNGDISELGDVDDDPLTTMSSHGDNITITANGNYYVWDGSALTEPTGGAFPFSGSVTYIDQRSILSQLDGDQFQWTDISNPKSLDPLNFATNESRNDKTLRALADRREVWFFGTQSIEIWYNTGQGGADAFARINGGALDTGCLGTLLSVKMDEGIFFIGDDRIAYITSGLGIRQISTPAVEQALEASIPTHCFYFEDRGHKFFAIRFDDRPAWVFDLATGLWHERSSGVSHGPWDVITTVKAFGVWFAGTSRGQILRMGRFNEDFNGPLRRTAVSRSLYMNGNQFSVSELEFLGRIGESDLGRDAEVMARFSKDGGRTWSLEEKRSLGDIGNRTRYAVYRALGTYRDFSVEFSITDPADISMYSSANVRIS